MAEVRSSETFEEPCQHLFELTCTLAVGSTPKPESALARIGGFRCATCGVALYPLSNGKPVEGISVPLVTTAPDAKPGRTAPTGKAEQTPAKSPDPAKGLPGTEMLSLTAELGIVSPAACGCKTLAAQMDKLGVDGCRAMMSDLKVTMHVNWESWGWRDKLKAVAASAWKAAGLGVNPTDPVRDLLEIAIERAEKKAAEFQTVRGAALVLHHEIGLAAAKRALKKDDEQ